MTKVSVEVELSIPDGYRLSPGPQPRVPGSFKDDRARYALWRTAPLKEFTGNPASFRVSLIDHWTSTYFIVEKIPPPGHFVHIKTVPVPENIPAWDALWAANPSATHYGLVEPFGHPRTTIWTVAEITRKSEIPVDRPGWYLTLYQVSAE